jgi:MFS transporter, ACS family, hexuronate transporter
MQTGRWRWIAISIFVISSLLNYLDRQLLAAGAPSIKSEFHLSNAQFGQIVSVFSIVYACMSPLAGMFIDRLGLNAGVGAAVVVWSMASIGTGFTSSFRGLLSLRTVLGIAEAGGIPGAGKSFAMYLSAKEFAMGTAVNQVGISLGLFAAPLVMQALSPKYGWRGAFIACGVVGLLWTPIWLLTSKLIPASAPPSTVPHAKIGDLLRGRQLWGLVFGAVFLMSLYTLWTNWTTLYFVEQWHLPQAEANSRFAWIPPIFATVGGFAGGWMALHWIRSGMNVMKARMRVCWICAIAAGLATLTIPLAPTPFWADVAISWSAFWAICATTNLYALPIDMFGSGRAAFGVSALTLAYGGMQAISSPFIGKIVDNHGFSAVCLGMAGLPIIGVVILQAMCAKPVHVDS